MPTAITTLDDEVQAADSFTGLLGRLNDQSVRKHFDAYEDVPWDDYPIDPTDHRWALDDLDPLGRTDWYKNLSPEEQSRLGLLTVATKMQVGYFFEGVLKRGLLEHAQQLPAGSPELRYVYHEVIEEAQHSLMFQEFCGRAGLTTVPKLPRQARVGAKRVVKVAKFFPELFFIFVLGGEDPIDHVQRESLRSRGEGGLHPLLERIMRIHVTEEARHLSFARHWLKRRVPELDPFRRLVLGIGAPLILGEMGGLMMRPSNVVVREFQIPDAVLREAYDDNPEWLEGAANAMRKVRVLCRDLGLITPLTKPLWKLKRIWSEDA